MAEVSRVITRNEMLCDGTPRRENGYRAYVRQKIGDIPSSYQQSPLFKTESEATNWPPIPKFLWAKIAGCGCAGQS